MAISDFQIEKNMLLHHVLIEIFDNLAEEEAEIIKPLIAQFLDLTARLNLLAQSQTLNPNYPWYDYMVDLRKLLNHLVVMTEESSFKDDPRSCYNLLVHHGIYNFVYNTNYAKGKIDEDVYYDYHCSLFLLIVPAIIVPLYMILGILTPAWLTILPGIFVGISAFITVIFNSVISHLLGVNYNLSYSLLGNQKDELSLVKTNNKIANAFAKGYYESIKKACLIGGLFLLNGVSISLFSPMAVFIMPTIFFVSIIVILLKELEINIKEEEYSKKPYFRVPGVNEYQFKHNSFMLPTKKTRISWLSNSLRDITHNVVSEYICGGGVIFLISYSVPLISATLPPVLFSTLFSVIIPGVSVAVPLIILIALAIYTYVKRNQQIINNTKLDFSDSNDNEPLNFAELENANPNISARVNAEVELLIDDNNREPNQQNAGRHRFFVNPEELAIVQQELPNVSIEQMRYIYDLH